MLRIVRALRRLLRRLLFRISGRHLITVVTLYDAEKSCWNYLSDERREFMDQQRSAEDERFMRAALELAREAELAGEVPVGAVVVIAGEIIATGRNAPISTHDPTSHAEMAALREAAAAAGNYRLSEATLYATLEPCVMCAGALVAARVSRLVFGARDLRFGGVRSKFRIADSELLNHRVEVVEGVLAAESTALLQEFFQSRRS